MLNQDYVKPEERLRRASDKRPRYGHITLFLIVAILAAYGLAQKADDMQAEREAVQLAEQAAVVVHKLKVNCGY